MTGNAQRKIIVNEQHGSFHATITIAAYFTYKPPSTHFSLTNTLHTPCSPSLLPRLVGGDLPIYVIVDQAWISDVDLILVSLAIGGE
jgi:hypothetical protein